MKYTIKIDDDGEETTIDGTIADARQAAEAAIEAGDWNVDDRTVWVDARIIDEDGDEERMTVAIDPPEPDCTRADGHVWRALHDVVGGIEENPGVVGHGGGVIVRDHCVVCGCGRTVDTWAQRPDTGEQGMRSMSYAESKHEFGIALVPGSAWVDIDGAEDGVQYAEAWGLHWLRGTDEVGPYETEQEAIEAAPAKVAAAV